MISQSLLPEFDNEMAITRKFVERVPDDKFEWQPHPKSMTLGRLAGHLCDLPAWGKTAIAEDFVDLAGPYRPAPFNNRQDLLNIFDKSVAETHSLVESASDETWTKPWSLKNGEQVIMTQPKIAIFRGFVLSHIIHHRAQLGVYYRLNDIPVPSTYGPSADEGQM
jgi:uncharacterized damage-inducible protein DinB